MSGDCLNFFESIKDRSGEKCKLLWNHPHETLLSWEDETASPHSPGPVANDEILIRHWVNPVHIDPDTGKLKPTAFGDLSNKGLSVNRLSFIELREIQEAAQRRVASYNEANPEKPQRSLVSYNSYMAGQVRAILDQGRYRALAVYDTANAQDYSHADVCVIDKQNYRSARTQLRDLSLETTIPFQSDN